MSDARTIHLTRLGECIRRFQQVNRFAVRGYGKKVSENLQGHIMIQVEAEGEPSIDDLVTALHVPQASLSRAVGFLGKEGLLRVFVSQKDRRVRLVSLTKAGRRDLEEWHTRHNFMTEDLATRFAGSELLRLIDYQKRFADGLGAEDFNFSSKVGAMRRQVLRITRGLELLRTDLFRPFGLSSLEWHLLAEIEQKSKEVVAKDLCVTFGAPTNTIATAVKSLEQALFVDRVPHTEDARKLLLQITRKGRGVLKRVLNHQLAILSDATESFSDEELLEFIVLSEKLFQIGEGAQKASEGIEIRRLTTQQEILEGRQFLLSRILEVVDSQGIPGEILADHNAAFGLFVRGELQGVCELSQSGEVKNLFLATGVEESVTSDQFFTDCLNSAEQLQDAVVSP